MLNELNSLGGLLKDLKKVVEDILEEPAKTEPSKYYKRGTEDVKTYPYREGDGWVIGPEAFTGAHNNVISYKGENYYRDNDVMKERVQKAHEQRIQEVVNSLDLMAKQADHMGEQNVVLRPHMDALSKKLRLASTKLMTA